MRGHASEVFPATSRFRQQRRLGAGGMGVVYQVYDAEREESLALKTMRQADFLASLKALSLEVRRTSPLQNRQGKPGNKCVAPVESILEILSAKHSHTSNPFKE